MADRAQILALKRDRPTLLERYGFPWNMGNGDGSESITSSPN
jgi:hypothetical protein